MWKKALGLAACAALVGGCAAPMNDRATAGGSTTAQRPQKCVVNIWLVEGEPVVDQDPVHTKSCSKQVRWVAQDGLKFDGAGIVFDKGTAPPKPACPVTGTGTTVICTFDANAQGQYRYSVYLVDATGKKLSIDPSLFID